MRTVALIPAYNAAGTIGEVVKRTLSFVDKVIVVNDGSTDATAKEAEHQGAEVLSIGKNTGKANAIRTGLRKCHGFDAVVLLDADLQHCPEEIPRLLEEIKNGADLCIGSRFLNGKVKMPLGNRFSNSTAGRIISFLSGQRLTDPQSGFRALNGKMAISLELRAERYAIEHIMILEAARRGLRIGEVPTSCVYGYETSSVRPVRDTLRVMYHILRFLLGRGGSDSIHR